MLKKLFTYIFFTLFSFTALAQKSVIKGFVADTLEKKVLENSAVLLIRSADSILVKTARTDKNGRFEWGNIRNGNYQLLISYPKMADYLRNISIVADTIVDLGQVNMELKSKLLNEVVIAATKKAIRMSGDTLVFQADSFAVRNNANVQELLKRLPGMEVDKNGAIKSQGKEVKTVLVDGDEFFGDDPLLATKYLKANAVDEVQVYERKSKTAELTGIDDGIKQKTINIKLKDNAKNGYLTTLDANAGTDAFQDYGGMIGAFKSKLKMAIFGTYSNLDNDSKINNSMRKLKGEDYDQIEIGDDGSSIMYSSGGDDDDDYYSSTGGLPSNINLGAHFSDKFHQNKMGLKLNIKVFDNKNTNHKTSDSQELLPSGQKFTSTGRTDDHSNVTGENIRGTYTYHTDSLSILKVSFGLKKNRTYNESRSLNGSTNQFGLPISQNNQSNIGEGSGDLFNGNINWSKKFKKKGRILSIDIQPESQHSEGLERSVNHTEYYNPQGQWNRSEDINLIKDNSGQQNSIGTRISYAELLSKRWSMEAGYTFKTIASSSNRLVYDAVTGSPQKVDSLSNNFKFINFSNIGKLIFQYKVKSFSISSGLEATQTNFELKDIDKNSNFQRNYLNLSPRTNLFYKISNSTSMSLNYNGFTQQPSIEQIQPVIQINTPLYQVIGNSSLRPSFTNNFAISYSSYLMNFDQFISANLNYGFTNNAIVTSEIVDDFAKRVSSFVNLNGNNSLSGNVYYSKGFSKLHFRMGLDLGFYRSENLAKLNGVRNKTINTQYNVKGTFNYYTSKIDLSYAPSASIMYGTSSIGGFNDGKSIIHNHEFSGTVQLPYRSEFNTTLSISLRPANASFGTDLNVVILNSYLATKLGKNEAFELKLTATDILNQKIGYNRFVGGNLISSNTFSYIPRYVLIGINWNLSGNFTKAPANP
ncbi:TonB-dependent receptor [Pedobacter gandavensis]|uniref:Outer membrane beta-barrel protein n=1 Tax=Pedobacter gandavensis TaxID=2679963 RepID=A0ABR6EU23_9SPHI|nr:TonB-dependent receptor [Pedobacter gandavensis]MBB2148765.1 outer membrane beta-barrel protein [Pedobacter gandavensis]